MSEAITSSSTSTPPQEISAGKEESENLKENQSSKPEKAGNSSSKSLSKDKVRLYFTTHLALKIS